MYAGLEQLVLSFQLLIRRSFFWLYRGAFALFNLNLNLWYFYDSEWRPKRWRNLSDRKREKRTERETEKKNIIYAILPHSHSKQYNFVIAVGTFTFTLPSFACDFWIVYNKIGLEIYYGSLDFSFGHNNSKKKTKSNPFNTKSTNNTNKKNEKTFQHACVFLNCPHFWKCPQTIWLDSNYTYLKFAFCHHNIVGKSHNRAILIHSATLIQFIYILFDKRSQIVPI